MGNVKKSQNARRYGMYCLVFSAAILLTAIILLKSFFLGYVFSFIVVNMSNANLIASQGKLSAPIHQKRPGNRLLTDVRLTSTFRYLLILLLSCFAYHVAAVLLGAPVFESFLATSYFSSFLTLLTIYPVCLYCWWNNTGFSNMLLIFLESKHETPAENYLYTMMTWSIIGAWFGAFPIPLDWDRPWQEWPTTCCVGALVGYAASHIHIGLTNVWTSYKDKRHLAWNIFV